MCSNLYLQSQEACGPTAAIAIQKIKKIYVHANPGKKIENLHNVYNLSHWQIVKADKKYRR